MHESDEQRQQRLKAIVVDIARDAINRREEIADMGVTAQTLWHQLLQQPVWHIAEGPKRKDFVESEEIWSVTPVVSRDGVG